MTRKFILSTLVYSIVTMIHGFTWHFNFFPEVYAQLGIYNREPPVIPLGFASMIIQGIILAYLYPRYYRGGTPVKEGIKFGLIMGFFLFSISTLANAAKIQVSSMSTWLAIQSAFHLIQFVVAGAGIGLVYGKLSKS
ncbi:DUF1761 domain-containing protein [bacterium]|nr:DUF1761 domain-containing protein [bacterium]